MKRRESNRVSRTGATGSDRGVCPAGRLGGFLGQNSARWVNCPVTQSPEEPRPIGRTLSRCHPQQDTAAPGQDYTQYTHTRAPLSERNAVRSREADIQTTSPMFPAWSFYQRHIYIGVNRIFNQLYARGEKRRIDIRANSTLSSEFQYRQRIHLKLGQAATAESAVTAACNIPLGADCVVSKWTSSRHRFADVHHTLSGLQ